MMMISAGSNEIQVYFDGLCQPYKPSGIACYAFVILAKKGHEQKQQEYSEYGLAAEPFSDNATNNVAEYTGVIRALEWLLEKYNYNNNQKIIIRGYSQLVINQIKGKYKVRAVKIIPLYQKVKSLLSKFKDIKIEWIPRDKNKEADELSNKAYQEILDSDPKLIQKISQHMATEDQLNLLKSQGITPEKYLSKIEARRLISKKVSKQE